MSRETATLCVQDMHTSTKWRNEVTWLLMWAVNIQEREKQYRVQVDTM